MATIYHQVWIDAPAAKVYAGLASAEGLSSWWVPHTSTETKEGLVFAHTPGTEHGDVQMKVVELVPDQRIVFEIISHHPKQSPASAWTGTTQTFEISRRTSPGHWIGLPDDGKTFTVLDFRHAGWDEQSEFFGFCNFAWGATLVMFQQWCEA
jgi:uncharacterized protein YndB with AHSA1/START domain